MTLHERGELPLNPLESAALKAESSRNVMWNRPSRYTTAILKLLLTISRIVDRNEIAAVFEEVRGRLSTLFDLQWYMLNVSAATRRVFLSNLLQ